MDGAATPDATSLAEDAGMLPDAMTVRDGGPAGERLCASSETCGNEVDDNCDGVVNERCACAPGDVSACFRGDPSHRTQGLCRDGTMVCEGGVEFGQWSACDGEVLEATEVCDAAGLDEDCDGAPNDGCECVEGDADVPCGIETGACVTGIQRCIGGIRSACEDAVGPEVETCNGIDDDCNGEIDDAITRACGMDEGVCRSGLERCVDGDWQLCDSVEPSVEACDGLDNDCDTRIDEGITRSCGSDTGRCVAGTETCTNNVFGECVGRVEAIAEICNDIDDDCDGPIDEGLTRGCGTDVGSCVAGTETCVAGDWGDCIDDVVAGTELCEGVADENCNGTVDEGCDCTSGEMRACGTDAGRCERGSQMCDASGQWGDCTGDVEPRTETCDGTDDNCNGTVDEDCDCITGAMQSCGSNVGECREGMETCDSAGQWGPCMGGVQSSAEICNARDDDCDTFIDEMGVCPRFPPVAMCPGAASTTVGTTITLAGGGADPDGGPVTYAWTVVTRPTGSFAAPTPSNAASPSFTPDVAGSYTLRLCITDDEGERTCCTVGVSAMATCTAPTAPTLTSCATSWDRRPIVQFAPLASGTTLELFLDGQTLPYGTVTMSGQNYHRPGAPIGGGGPPPGLERSIHARVCRSSDPSCCATSAPVRVRLVEACTTPVAPTASNIVFSEYVADGDGPCPGPSCEAGEAIEITNLSHCPVSLAAHHFGYCNPEACGAFRWMDFGTADVIPPRGVYVAIRNRAGSSCSYPFFGPDDPSLFGLRISQLAVQGDTLTSGWFNNAGGGRSVMRIATGPWSSITSGTTLEIIAPYSGAAAECRSIGFDAIGECGDISAVATPSEVLSPNQLGRLWHPCDAVVAPVPSGCR